MRKIDPVLILIAPDIRILLLPPDQGFGGIFGFLFRHGLESAASGHLA